MRPSEQENDPYVTPPASVDFTECAFYHVMDLPGHGSTSGEWDLRGHELQYLGHVDLAGRRVFEVGPASGCLTFFMESQGAEVVGMALPLDHEVDLPPYARADWRSLAVQHREHLQMQSNSWWFAHRAFASHARLAHGSIYDPPAGLGHFDVSVLGAVLLHLRDPLLAIQQAAKLTTGTMVVTDLAGAGAKWWRRLLRRFTAAHLNFLPNAKTGQPIDGFWGLNAEVVVRMLAVVGFECSTVTYHTQRYVRGGRDVANFTVVAHRAAPNR